MQQAADRLLQALNEVHNPSTDREVRHRQSRYLEDWQSATEAWTISDAVLHEPSCPLQLQFYCAQTLRVKVQRDFEELPEQAVATLRSSLADLLLQFYKGPSSVRTQLALAIAAMAAHAPAASWEGGGPLPWFAGRISGRPSEAALACMLELLTVLPQEGTRGHLPAVKPERRRVIKKELAASTPVALQMLTSCLIQQDGAIRERVLKAFAAWTELGGMVSMDAAQLSQHPLVEASLAGLGDEDVFDACVEAVVQLICMSSAAGSPQEHMQPLVQRLVPAVLQQRGRFTAALTHAMQAAPDDVPDDADLAKGLGRMFAELAECYCSLIATGASEYLQPVQVMLEVAAYPDPTINSMSFNFWGNLAHDLTTGFSQLGANGNVGAQEEQRRQRVSIFAPAFSRLVEVIRGHCRYPDNWRSLDRAERSEFKRSRIAIGDTLTDAAGVLGGNAVLKLLLEPLSRSGTGADFDWRTAEASLFCIRSVNRAHQQPGEELLVQLFTSLIQLPAEPQLQYTASLLVGAYSDWLAASVKDPQHNFPAQVVASLVTHLLLPALSHADSVGGAASALRHVCEDCGAFLGAAAQEVLATLQRCHSTNLPNQLPPPPNSLQLQLQERYVQQVMEAAAYLVGHMPQEQRNSVLSGMLGIVTGPMHAALAAGDVETVVVMADRLTIIFRFVADPASIGAALQQVWPLLESAMRQCCHSSHAIEQLCRIPRYALRTCGPSASGLLPMVGDALPRWYSATRNPSFLYIVSELLKVFGKDAGHKDVLGNLFARLILEACSHLTTLDQFDNDPDAADDVFLMASSAMQNCPSIVLTDQVLPVVVQCAAAGILVQHRDACSSVHSFVKRLYGADILARAAQEEQARWQSRVPPVTPVIMRRLMAGMLAYLPYNISSQIPDVIMAILKVGGESGLAMLTQCIMTLPLQAASAAEQQRVLETATEAVANGMAEPQSAHLDAALTDLADLCRRNPRALEAAERALVPEIFALPGSGLLPGTGMLEITVSQAAPEP